MEGVLLSLSLAISIFLCRIAYHWAIGKRDEALRRGTRLMAEALASSIVVLVALNVELVMHLFNIPSSLVSYEAALSRLEGAYGYTAHVYQAILSLVTFAAGVEISMSIAAALLTSGASEALIRLFSQGANASLDVLSSTAEMSGTILMGIAVLKSLLSIGHHVGRLMMVLGAVLVPLGRARRIGLTLLVWGGALGLLLPFAVNSFFSPTPKGGVPGEGQIEYGLFSLSVQDVYMRPFKVASVVVAGNYTSWREGEPHMERLLVAIPFTKYSSWKTVPLPAGNYSIVGVLTYWGLFKVCTSEYCPPGFVSNARSFSIEKGRETKVIIRAWRLYLIPCNSTDAGVAPSYCGLAYGIYSSGRTYSYIRFRGDRGALYWETTLSNATVETYSVSRRPVVIVNSTGSINYTIDVMRSFGSADFALGERMAEVIVREYEEWWLRNRNMLAPSSLDVYIVSTCRRSPPSCNVFRQVGKELKAIVPRQVDDFRGGFWRVRIRSAGGGSSGSNGTFVRIILPAAQPWDYAHLSYNSLWDRVEEDARRTRSTLSTMPLVLVYATRALVNYVVMFAAVDALSPVVGGYSLSRKLMTKLLAGLGRQARLSASSLSARISGLLRRKMGPLAERPFPLFVKALARATDSPRLRNMYMLSILGTRYIERYSFGGGRRRRRFSPLYVYRLLEASRIFEDLGYVAAKSAGLGASSIGRLGGELLSGDAEIYRRLNVRVPGLRRMLDKRERDIVREISTHPGTIPSLKGEQLDRAYRASKAYIAESILRKEFVAPMVPTLVRMKKIVEATEGAGVYASVNEILKKVFIYTSLFAGGSIDQKYYRGAVSKLEADLKKTLALQDPWVVYSLLKVTDDPRVAWRGEALKEDVRLRTMLLEESWLQGLYTAFTKIEEILPADIRSGLRKKFDDIVVSRDLSGNYAGLLYLAREALDSLRTSRRIPESRVLEFERFLERAEGSLYYLPPWISGSPELAEAAIKILKDQGYMPRPEEEQVFVDEDLENRIVIGQLRNIDPEKKLAYYEFALEIFPYAARIDKLEKEIKKLFALCEDLAGDDIQALLGEIEDRLKEVEADLRLIVQKAENRGLDAGIWRRKLSYIVQVYYKLRSFRNRMGYED